MNPRINDEISKNQFKFWTFETIYPMIMNIFSAAVPKNIILNSTMLIYQNISQYLWIFLKFIFQFLNIYGIWGNINKNRKIQYFKKLIELKKMSFALIFY